MAEKPEFNGWEHAKRATVFVWSNVASAAKACGLWLALIAFVTVALGPAAVWLVQNDAAFAAFVRSFEDERIVQLILMIPLLVLTAIAWPSIAVAWHCFVLRREEPPILPFFPARGGIYLLLAAALTFVVWILPGAALAFAFAAIKRPNEVILLIWIAIFAGLLGLSMRFSLKLPAIAVRDRRMTFARSWRDTESMWPGMLWGTVVLTVPLYIATKAADVIAGRFAEQGQTEVSLLLGVVNLTAIFIGLLLYATFLSFCYQKAVGDTSTAFD